jgi:hypothetical protein
LYCDGNIEDVSKAKGDERSYGVMQINLAFHPNVHVENFEENVRYGINYLISNYKEDSKSYACKNVNYSGWQRALRGYNGWNVQNGNIYCWKEINNKKTMIGDHDYVEHVLGNKGEIEKMFPECGGVSEEGIKVTYKLII